LLVASAEPLSERMLSNRLPKNLDAKALLKALQHDYANRGVNLVRAGNSWAFRTADDLSAVLNVEAEVSRKMSRATIETMAIVAYHQPVTRAEIEEIRGVSLSKGTLDSLFEKEWIKPRGRRETPGRPMTWGTTDAFLDHFGLSRVTDLPGMDELRAAGLLESGPALNVYRSRGGLEHATPPEGAGDEADDTEPAALSPFSQQGEEGALPDLADEAETEEPLDPEAI
jgi:segregation and condensation protein B